MCRSRSRRFRRKYTTEVFTVVAIVIGAISSMFDFFAGPSLTILFTAIGVILGIFFPAPVENGLKQLYGFIFKQEKTTQIIIGAVQIVIGLFIPFLLFGVVGLLAGTSYHYYTRHAQILSDNNPKPHRHSHREEHD